MLSHSRLLTLETVRSPIHQYWTVGIPNLWDRNADSQTRKIDKTNLVSAQLEYFFDLNTGVVTVGYYVNDQLVKGYPNGGNSGTVDVTGLLRSGTNTFAAWAYKKYGYLDVSYRTAIFDTALVLTYPEGEVPEEPVGPPEPPPFSWEDFLASLPWWWPIPVAALGAGVFYYVFIRAPMPERQPIYVVK